MRRSRSGSASCPSILPREVLTLTPALAHLRERALSRGYKVNESDTDSLSLEVDVPHADGVKLQYRLIVRAQGNILLVQEEPLARQLPDFCPERHIVADGTFCMYWGGEISFAVTGPESAEIWLILLSNFLRLQRRAAKLRCWPNKETWAHGDGAARQQLRAEHAAQKLGAQYQEALEQRTLKVTSCGSGVFRVTANGQPMFSVGKSPDRFDRSGHRRTLAYEFGPKHQRHAKNRVRAECLLEMAQALMIWQESEIRFWNYYQDRACCGTMDGCPLRRKENK